MKGIQYLFSKRTKSILKIENLSTIDLNNEGAELIDDFLKGADSQDIEVFINEIRDSHFYINRDNMVYKDNSFENIPMSLMRKVSVPIIHIIQNCNSPCVMCDCWKTKQKIYHKFEVLKPLFDHLREMGVSRIMISGGEPLMHPELKEIIQYLNDVNIDIELNTNGILLGNNLWLLDYNIEDIVISIDGINKEDYKFIRGRDKFDLVIKNIKLFKEYKKSQSIGARVTLTKNSIVNIIEFINFLQDNEIDFIGFSPLDTESTSFSRNNIDLVHSQYLEDNLIPNENELIVFKNKLENKSSKEFLFINEQYNLNRISWNPEQFLICMSYYLKEELDYLSSSDSCNFPYTSFVVDYNGDILSCFYSNSFGSIYDITNIDWDSHIPIMDLHKSNQCKNCRGKVFCG